MLLQGIACIQMSCAVDLVPDNLKKVCDLVWDARSKWFDLGFQLDVKYIELEVVEKDCSNVNSSFRKMLSTWLKMIDPPPSWEDLLTALEHDSVKCGDLAERIRLRFGIFKQPESAIVLKTPSSSQVAESTTEQVVKPKRTSATCTIHSLPVCGTASTAEQMTS